MYRIDERDRIVSVDTIPHARTGVSDPVVMADENSTALRYFLLEEENEQERVAILRFDGCWAHYFGPPNSEALDGHPLYERGLSFYGIFEVLDSSWIRLMEERNRVHPSHSPARYAGLRHFIFTFEDSTFECIAEAVTVQIVLFEDVATAWARILHRTSVAPFHVRL
jgi:hypothetical protein